VRYFLMQIDRVSNHTKGIIDVRRDYRGLRQCSDEMGRVGYLRSYRSFPREVILVENTN